MRLTAAEAALNEFNEVLLAIPACIRLLKKQNKKRGNTQTVFSRQVPQLVVLPEKLHCVDVVLTTACAFFLQDNRDSPLTEQVLGNLLLNRD